MDIHERYRRQPITGEMLVGIVAPALREFRRQADAQVDAKIAGVNAKLDELRQELGLPVAKARVRVPVGRQGRNVVMPQPDRTTVGNVARLLATMNPTAAGDAALLIMAAIADGLAARGWRQDHAERFACDFGRQIAAHIATLARPTLH